MNWFAWAMTMEVSEAGEPDLSVHLFHQFEPLLRDVDDTLGVGAVVKGPCSLKHRYTYSRYLAPCLRQRA